MKKTSSLSELGFSDAATTAFFRQIKDVAASSAAAAAGDAADAPSQPNHRIKISIVGAGNVGMAIAQTILTQDLADEIALVDAKPEKLRGEMLDLQHAAAFLPRVRIVSGTDYAVTAGSDLAIVTAGARQLPGETRLDLLHRNVALFRTVVPPLAQHSPDALLLVVSNPVDVLTYVAWKLSGFPPNRHGDSSVALWSSISIGGVPMLSSLRESDVEFEQAVLERIRKAVVGSAYEVIRLKGYTSWAIGYSVASLARSLLRNQHRIHPISLLASGFHGIPDDREVFLSLPAVLGRSGVIRIPSVQLTEEEGKRLRKSAQTLWEIQQQLGLAN
ncbi:L-lactate dehydrogenase A [Ananas comosus]|uniref:L-lactate dehydrogenase A n=1 Tax=Ananas comosus TaxID=4615 RepID=A0A199W7X5_ANACO|nr:L-lactate dehydrogenase A [Ananas comosus]